MRSNKHPPMKQATRRYKRRRAELLSLAQEAGPEPMLDRVRRKPRRPGIKEMAS